MLMTGCRKEESDHYSGIDTVSFIFAGQGPQHADAMIRMDRLEDNNIRFKTLKAFGEDAAGNIEYRLVGGKDAIGVTRSGVAMVELSIVIISRGNKHVHQDDDGKAVVKSIMSALVRWTFAPQSDKCMEMHWSTISDALQQVAAAAVNDD